VVEEGNVVSIPKGMFPHAHTLLDALASPAHARAHPTVVCMRACAFRGKIYASSGGGRDTRSPG
jgi:hypothetical protein